MIKVNFHKTPGEFQDFPGVLLYPIAGRTSHILLLYVEEVLDFNLESKCYPLQKQTFNLYQTIMIPAIHLRLATLHVEYNHLNVTLLNKLLGNFNEDEY